MKKFKKVFAVILSLAMVLGMSLTSFAAEGKPDDGDKATVTINGVNKGATVKAFQIATGNWNSYGFTGYSKIEFTDKAGQKHSMSDISAPSAESILELSNIVDKTGGTKLIEGKDSESGSVVYTAKLNVGVYMVLVTENGQDDKTIYNPMIVSVSYNKDGSAIMNEASGGTVFADKDYDIVGSSSYAKKDTPTIDKIILDPGSGNNKGDDTAINDTIRFEITSTIPQYTSAYTSADYSIIDTLSKGLTVDSSTVLIKVGGEPAELTTDYSVSVSDPDTNGNTTMTIAFTNTDNNRYVLKNQGKTIVVNYSATLNENATINYEANTNTVKAVYTNNPATNSNAETEEKRTYHYTFGIDANLNGEGSNPTGELFKTDENDDGEFVEGAPIVTPKHPLNGAKFRLTRVKDNKGGEITNGKSYVAISGIPNGTDDDGNIIYMRDGALQFTGLDDGEYELVEIEPPKGYSLNDKVHTVTIKASYDEDDGTLKEYHVLVDGVDETGKDSVYQGHYETDNNGQLVGVIDHRNEDSALIKNTKMASLPSTGGIGTTIFTIGGCAIMIIAAALFFASRRKSAK